MNRKILNESRSTSFWKESSNVVPGNPQKDEKLKNVNPKNSFSIYEKSVLDAWDVLEDNTVRVYKNNTTTVLKTHIAFTDNGNVEKLNIKKRAKKPKLHLHLGNSFNNSTSRLKVFLQNPTTIEELQKLCWNGIPSALRPTTWKLLSEYLPLDSGKHKDCLERKRNDYWNFVLQYYDQKNNPIYKDTFHQIHIDVPRMSPSVPLFQNKTFQEMFQRILFLWAISHPASGYVQGMNDLVTPFFLVFLEEYIEDIKMNDNFIELLSKESCEALEADIYWCLSKFMSGIQENYIFAQTGIQKNINKLQNLIQRIDSELHRHLVKNEINYIQFSFRWFNNLLTRELPIKCIIRLWDTYLSEGDYFPQFLPYVCASFLLHWREDLLKQSDFQSIMVLLQNLSTKDWSDFHISLIVAEAYKLKVMFADAPKHLEQN